MEENENHTQDEEKCVKRKTECTTSRSASAPGSAVYGLGFIGAAIYYISIATNFWAGVLGFLKAIVWPVFLVYEALKFFAG